MILQTVNLMHAFICSFIYSLGTEQKMKLINSQLEELFLKTILQEQKVLIGFNSINCGFTVCFVYMLCRNFDFSSI